MPGLEQSIKNIKEFKESFEGLRVEPRLIAIDGPDGVGKTEITQKVVSLLKNQFEKDGKDPNTILYLKHIKLQETESQKRLLNATNKVNEENKHKVFDKLQEIWMARTNRSYADFIVPKLKEGKIIVMDRSEIDVIRGSIEWSDKSKVNNLNSYLKNGTLTKGILPGNRIFISASPEDIWQNLSTRLEPFTPNDPKSFADVLVRIENEKKAEEIIEQIETIGQTNFISIKNPRIENTIAKDAQIEKIAREIILKIKL